jgi:hypothetical protein
LSFLYSFGEGIKGTVTLLVLAIIDTAEDYSEAFIDPVSFHQKRKALRALKMISEGFTFKSYKTIKNDLYYLNLPKISGK